MKIRPLAVLGVVGLAAAADAGTMYTVRTSDRVLVRIDTETWTFTDVGPLGTGNFDFGDLAFDPATGTLYMVTGFAGFNSEFWNLYTVDTTTGGAELVGNHGIGDLFGLAFDETGGFWASRSTTGTGFYAMDRVTGGAEFVGDPGISLDGLTWDSTRDQVVGLYAGPGSLHAIDRATGEATLLSGGGGFVNNCGIAYDPEADLIYAIDWSGLVYSFDPDNGYAREEVLKLEFSHDGLALVPEGSDCVADFDGNGVLNIFDFLAFQTAFSNEDPAADLAAPFGVFNIFDFLAFQTAFGNGC